MSELGCFAIFASMLAIDLRSLVHISSQAYYLRDQDVWTKIDYQAEASTWMQPLRRGNPTGLVEIPGNWYLDDLPPMMCVNVTAH